MKISYKKNEIESVPFFIFGAQRSGTTLLRLMLNAHSKVAIPEEGGFWMPLLRKFKKNFNKRIKSTELEKYIEYINNSPQYKLWCNDDSNSFENIKKKKEVTLSYIMSTVYENYAKSKNKILWGDKTPSFFRMIPVLSKLFPNAKYIHIYRDGRDVYLSWQAIDKTKRNISLIALEWVYKLKRARKDLENIDSKKVIEVKYESLVSKPEENLKKICNFISIEYEETMLDFWKSSNQFIGAHHSKLINSPVSLSSVAKWKKKLSNRQISKFEIIAGKILKENGYEISQQVSKSITNYFIVFFELILGFPFRTAQIILTRINFYTSATFGFELVRFEVGEKPEKKSNT
jgi:sulfotransferase family protein